MNLKHKIVVLISVLLLSVSVGSSFFNHIIDVRNAQEQLKNTALPLSVDNIYTEVQQRMIEPLLVSSMMANDTFLKDWVIGGESDEVAITKYLREIQEKYQVFTTFFVSSFTHHYYHPKGIIDTVNENNSEDDWFFNFQKSKETHEINLDYNKNLDHSLIMFINYKVQDYMGAFIGAAGIGIKLFNLEEMLDVFKKKYRYDVYFIDENGEIVLYSKSLDKRGNIHSTEGLRALQKKIVAEKNIQVEYANKDGEYLLTTKYIDKLKLYLFVEVNKKEYMSDLQKTFFMNLMISLFVTTLVTFIILYTINIYQRQLEELASEDGLTKLANRRTFNDYFEKIFRLYKRNIHHISLILMDVDDFKNINDSMGHLTGDKVLVRIAQILQENFRNSDMIARWGGEEFAILLVDTQEADALLLAEKLRQAMASDEVLQELCHYPITASVGVGELQNIDSQDGLISRVDKAMYRAKAEGKNKVVRA